MKSPFRPAKLPDPAILDNHQSHIRLLERRGVLRGALSLGALSMLTGCDVSSDPSVDKALRRVSSWNDRVQAALFDPTHLAPTYPKSMILKPPKFNAYYDITEVKPVSAQNWKLEVAGLVADKSPWTPERLATLPETEMVIKHICVEGWDYIGQWSGPRLKEFLVRVGADLTARYVEFHGNDDYMESIDMASALHPQTILATRYAGEPIGVPYGYPLRLRTAVKLGYKNPKWIRAITVTNTYNVGFWEKQGFNWFAGL
jgi:DMSO/TMAO reductase YedYZ molybdopterin-dependent catalytic subunit